MRYSPAEIAILGLCAQWDALDFYAARVDWYGEWITADIRAFLAGRRRCKSGL